MDDESGWNEILVQGWGPLVRDAVCERVERAFAQAPGVLAVATVTPDDAPAHCVEPVHDAVLAAIAVETGAQLDELGSQAAWATYDEVWATLGRRWEERRTFEPVPAAAVADVVAVLRQLPRAAVEHAGAFHDVRGLPVLVTAGRQRVLDVEGVYRWLAVDEDADMATRDRARTLVTLVRG